MELLMKLLYPAALLEDLSKLIKFNYSIFPLKKKLKIYIFV